jgi:hypothetical protein
MTRRASAALFLLLAADARAARLTLCALSFHSPDEVRVFETELPAADFEIVDLSPRPVPEDGVPVSSPPVAEGPRAVPVWNLCRRDLRCDVVVYSAEFAGRFFGRYGASLSLQDMEEASCQARCAGFFHHPREVFLLACNTLATKNEDNRTPAEYLEVLMNHGFDRASAERVVQARYGALGPSFREALRRIFMDVPRLYGFSSVAPTGEHTAPLLERYFRAKRDYRRYLEAAGRDTAPNRELLAAFRGTGLVQTSGLTAEEPAAADRDEICGLYDKQKSVVERLEIVRRLMRRDDVLGFLPTIQVFVDRHPAETLAPEERKIFEEIQRSDAARERLLGLVRELDVCALRTELAHFAVTLGWLTPQAFHDLAVGDARQLLHQALTSEAVDVVCTIPDHVSLAEEFTSSDLPGLLFENPEGLRLIDCLAPKDARVSDRLAGGLDSPDVSLRLWSVYALSRRRPLSDAVLARLAAHLDDPVAEVRERVRWILKVEAPLPAAVRRIVDHRDPALAEELTPHATRRRFLFW